MNKGPIIIVDDDTDDKEFLQEAWEELEYENELIFFRHGNELLHYLKDENISPFIILCDVNIPGMDGFELREKLRADPSLNYKSIPFLFWSTTVSRSQTQKAYDLGIHGFFVKGTNLKEIKQSLIDIIKYWSRSIVPD